MTSGITNHIIEMPDIMKSLELYYMITRTDGEGLITYTNHNFLDSSKWTPKRVLGKSIWQMFPDYHETNSPIDAIWSWLKNGKSWFGTTEKMTRSGELYYVTMLAVPIMSPSGQLQSATFIELDKTEDVKLQQQLQEIAFIDVETGLMSRHKLELLVNDHIEEAKHFSFVYITIDHYYTIKELQSHDSETELIRAFTNRLKRFFQDNPIARIGANHFAILTPFGDWYIQGFLQFLEQQPIYIDNNVIPLSISGGIARYPEDQKSYTQLLTASMTVAQDVVNHGGGRIVSLSAEYHKDLNRRMMIDRKLLTELNIQNLSIVYQPQLDLASGEIKLYEALVRWEDEELGRVMPDELIPIAEENGAIQEIGAYVIEEAARLIVQKHQTAKPIQVAINTSVREFAQSAMKNKISNILREAGCPPTAIQLEITEKFALQAEEESSIISQMKLLQDEGVEFALDDFGTGYASFRYMQDLPISKVKIDKIFIASLLTHPKTKQLVSGMIQFSKTMGLYVIAEGVETEEQFELLKEMGVDAVQGYYIGEPVDAKDIE